MIKTTGTAVNDCNEDFMSPLLAALAASSIGIYLLINTIVVVAIAGTNLNVNVDLVDDNWFILIDLVDYCGRYGFVRLLLLSSK